MSLATIRVDVPAPFSNAAVRRSVAAAVGRTARFGQRKVKSITPVRTGRLKRSISVLHNQLRARIFTIVPYAKYVEPRRHMFANSRAAIAAKFREEIRTSLRVR